MLWLNFKMIKITWDKNALIFLRKLERADAKRIIKKINLLGENTKHHLKPLVNIDAYKLRVGDYRVFVDVDKEEIIIRSIKHRKNAYKN